MAKRACRSRSSVLPSTSEQMKPSPSSKSWASAAPVRPRPARNRISETANVPHPCVVYPNRCNIPFEILCAAASQTVTLSSRRELLAQMARILCPRAGVLTGHAWLAVLSPSCERTTWQSDRSFKKCEWILLWKGTSTERDCIID